MAKAPKSESLAESINIVASNYTLTAQTGQPINTGTAQYAWVNTYGPAPLEIVSQPKKSVYTKKGSYEWLERHYPTVYNFVCANGISESDAIDAYILWKKQSDALLMKTYLPSATNEDVTNYQSFKFSTFMFDKYSYKEDPDIVYE